MTEDDKLARNRLVMLNLVRLSGLAMVLIGIAIHFGKIASPEWVAYVFTVMGLADFFFMPNLVARNWRTPDE
jgi:hypothetical protein